MTTSASTDRQRDVVEIGDRRLMVERWGAGPPRIVLLHDGLGSISLWRGLPAAIAQRTGVGVLAYDRAGHGASTPPPTGAWPADWLHRESTVLDQLLDQLGIEFPLLVGHSDGGSIALLHAAGGGGCSGLVTLAAHTWVEHVCVDAIARMRTAPEPIVAGLARHHDEPEALFEAWSGVWTGAAFRSWDVRPSLHAVSCPTVVVQGTDDEYASDTQLTETVASIGANAVLRRLEGCGHLIHRDALDVVVGIVDDVARDLFGPATASPVAAPNRSTSNRATSDRAISNQGS